jgi:D-alanyl-D-alanine carboxypeptidase (penicillin-binding protein 5/6)
VGGRRVEAAVVGAGLVAGLVVSTAAMVGAVPVARAAAVPAVVPCPHVTPPTIPPTPAIPAHDPAAPVVGGAQLDTTGLAVPDGVAAPPAVSAMSWVVADLDSGAVIGACDPHLRRRPASVQKLLLAETALPELDPDRVVEATAEDLALPPVTSAVGLLVGGHYTVATLWYGLLLESGNDAANALARAAGGDGGVAATVAAMNAEAQRLGAEDTHAANPSGLDAPDQYSSAYDLALIARADFARPDFVRYDTTLRMQWPAQPPRDPRGFQIQNENKLLVSYPGALGGKTGFTDEARHTYVGAAQRGGRRLVVTLMGAEIVPARAWRQGATLLDWGFGLPAMASVGHLVTPEEASRLRSPPVPTATPAPAGTVAAAPVAAGTVYDTLTLIPLFAVPLLVLALIGQSWLRRAVRRAGPVKQSGRRRP